MHSKTIIRLLCLVFALCFAVCALAACGEEDKKDDEKETTAATTAVSTEAAGALKASITVDGKTLDVTTSAKTVKDLLAEQKITLGKDDEISAKLDAPVTADMKIVIKRVEYKEEVKKEEIKFDTIEQTSTGMAAGTSEITQQGVNGEKEVTYKVKYVDGKEESREKVSEKVTKEAVAQITTIGAASSDDGGDDDGGDDEVYVVDVQDMPDCDGSGHGYRIITYSDGNSEIEEY